MEMYKTPEAYFDSVSDHLDILMKIRTVLLATELEEKMKWGIPTYCLKNKNVAGIGAFKTYAGIWFFNGVFLKDESKVLINAQEGKTKGLRQWRFSSIEEIDEDLLKRYIEEAIQNQKDGKEVKPEKKALAIPDELKEALASNSSLAEAFEALTLGKRKEYAEHIEEAKRVETKMKRLEKIEPMILKGIGLNDKYK